MKINLLDTAIDRRARRTTVLVAAVFALLVGTAAAIGAGASYRAAAHGTDVLSEVGGFFAFAELKRLVWGGDAPTENDPLKTPDGRLNVLLLGIGGAGHEGAQLTDTVIFASFDNKTDKLGFVSLPRDLAFPLGGGRYQKLNSLNAYYELEHPGEGARLTADALEKLLGVRIDRVIKIDFKGFEELIDALGGIDVNVERSFTDSSFPTAPNGSDPYKWTSVSFTKGMEHMDGARALTFARSRHGTNGENSDFARSRRQQIVIMAIRERLLSLGTLGNPKTVSEIWTTVSSHIETNLTAWDAIKLIPAATRFSKDNVVSRVLTDGPDGELVPGNVEGAFMLFPKNGDWTRIRELAMNPFETKEELAKANRPAEPITLEIRNGTYRTGFAAQVAMALEQTGYTIAHIGNAENRGYERTVIYDLTNGSKPAELAKLKKMLNANVSVVSAASSGAALSGAHFSIVLGESSLGLVSEYAGR